MAVVSGRGMLTHKDRPREIEECKIVLMGGGGVGKSVLAIQYVTGKFLEEFNPTIEDSYRKQAVIDGKSILLDILDTAGQEEFSSMHHIWHTAAEVLVIVYDVTSRSTFDEATMHYQKIQQSKEEKWNGEFPVVLVGNKCDLIENREVDKSEAENLVKKWGEHSVFIETSAKQPFNVDELFESAVRILKNARNRQLDDTAKTTNKSDSKPVSCNTDCCNPDCCNYDCCKYDSCNCACFKISDWYHALKDETAKENENMEKDKIQFIKNNKQPSPDKIPDPIYSLKDFGVQRVFHWDRFLKAIICGLFLPIIIILQTMAFLSYSEFKEAKFYPKIDEYEDIHASIFYDFLGIVIGRRPGQDPETVKDRRWFLRQTKLQKLKRIAATIIITVISSFCFYNLSQVNNKDLRVSLMETIGPITLFWIVWLLLSLWIAYEIKLTPPLPSPLRLRSVLLYLGEKYQHVTSAYKFLRAYYASRDRKWVLPWNRTILIVSLGILYALIPGITRMTVGDPSDGLEEKKFITTRESFVSVGAIIVNFSMVTSFVYAIEVQYRKHFDNYKKWMYDITMLLHKDNSNDNTDNDDHYEVKKGQNFSEHIFLSLARKSNGLAWLEIRSFLAVEGKILFAEQELPTSWMVLSTISLSIFILYRVYFIDGFPLQSILFNGCIMLAIICVVSLMRIAITGYQFENIQYKQKVLLVKQKFFTRCHQQGIDAPQIKSPKLNKLRSGTYQDQDQYKNSSHSIEDNDDEKEMTECMNDTANKVTETKTNPQGYEEIEEEEANSDDTKNEDEDTNTEEDVTSTKPTLLYGRKASNGHLTTDHVDIKSNGTITELTETQTEEDGCEAIKDMESKPFIEKQEVRGDDAVMNSDTDNKYDDVNDDQEHAPLLGGRKGSKETILLTLRDSIGLEFINDMLDIVQTKDIYPLLFGVKLNSVLAKAIAVYFFTGIATIFKLFVN